MAVTNIERCQHSAVVGARTPPEQFRLPHRRGAHDNCVRAGREEPVDVEFEANPTGHMDPDVAAMGQALDKGVGVTLTARGVKVDDMD
jgi:hypothetical protein